MSYISHDISWDISHDISCDIEHSDCLYKSCDKYKNQSYTYEVEEINTLTCVVNNVSGCNRLLYLE